MQSYIPYHLLRKPTPSRSDISSETAAVASDGDSALSREEQEASETGVLDTPSSPRAPLPPRSGPPTPFHHITPLGHDAPRSEAMVTPASSQAPTSTSSAPEPEAVSMVRSLLTIVATISDSVNRMREQQERIVTSQNNTIQAHAAATAKLSVSVEEMRERFDMMMRFPLHPLSRIGDEHINDDANGFHTRDPTTADPSPHHSPIAPIHNGDAHIPNGDTSTFLTQLNAQSDAIANLQATVEGMREHFEAQTRSFRSQADSCAMLAEAAKREGRGTGMHVEALKNLSEEVDSLGIKHMRALTNHGVTLNTLRASVDAHSNRIVALHNTVEGLRPPAHAAKGVPEAVAAVRASTAALEKLALGEIATKNDTLASRTAAYTAERERMAGEMAALRARCNEAENAARTQIQAKNDQVRKITAERDRAKEEMFKAKEELYAATSRLCSKCAKRFEMQRTQNWLQ